MSYRNLIGLASRICADFIANSPMPSCRDEEHRVWASELLARFSAKGISKSEFVEAMVQALDAREDIQCHMEMYALYIHAR